MRLCCRRLTGGTGVSGLQPADEFSHSAAFFQQQRAEQLAAPSLPASAGMPVAARRMCCFPRRATEPHCNAGTAAAPARQVRPPSDTASATLLYPEPGPELLTSGDAERLWAAGTSHSQGICKEKGLQNSRSPFENRF